MLPVVVMAVGAVSSQIQVSQPVMPYSWGLWPMRGKTGAARIALSTGAPVVPIAQWGVHEILAPYAKRSRLFPRKTIYVCLGDPLNLSDLRDQEETPKVLREATDRIMAALTAMLAEIREEPAPEIRFDPAKMHLPLTGNPHRNTPRQPRRSAERRNRGKGAR